MFYVAAIVAAIGNALFNMAVTVIADPILPVPCIDIRIQGVGTPQPFS